MGTEEIQDPEKTQIDGKPFWLFADGTLLPLIAGGADDDGGDDSDGDDDGDDGDSDSKDGSDKKTFTQADVNRLAAKEKKEGKRAGIKSVMEELGIKDLDEAKQALEAIRKKNDGTEDAEQQKQTREQVRKELEKEFERDKARIRLEAKAELALIKAGLKAEKTDKVLKMLDIDSAEDLDDINDQIEDIKKDFPEMFQSKNSDEDDEGKKEPKSTKPGTQPRKKGPEADATKTRLQQRHGTTLARLNPKT